MYIICFLKVIWNPCMFIRLDVINHTGFMGCIFYLLNEREQMYKYKLTIKTER
jgi:hypothetical protein